MRPPFPSSSGERTGAIGARGDRGFLARAGEGAVGFGNGFASTDGESLRLVSRRTWLVSVVPTVMSLIILGFSGVTATLSCRRAGPSEVDCTVVRSLLGFELARAELNGLAGASLRRTGGRTAVYRVDLDARSGARSLTPPYSSGAASNEQIVRAINEFVGDERARYFTASEERPLTLTLVGLVFLGVGLLASPLGSPIVTWTFDRAPGSLSVNRRRFSAGKTTSYRLDEIVSASVWSGLVTLGLTSGHRLQLSSAHAHEAVQQIRGFLGLPCAPASAPQGGPTLQRGSPDVFAPPSPGRERGGPERPPPPPPPPPDADGAATYRSFRDRLAGVVLFRASAYRAVAEDPAATRSALAIVLSVAALVGIVSGMTSHGMLVNGRSLPPGPLHGAARMVIEISAGLVSWQASAAVGSFVARALFRGRTDTSEMLRVLGYAGVFRFLCVLPHGSAPAWLLSTAGTVIAMREAAEFDTRRAFITAAITWVVAFAVSGVVWLLLSLVVMSVATPLG